MSEYCGSLAEYKSMLLRPTWDSSMLTFQHSDWLAYITYWNLMYTLLGIAITSITYGIATLFAIVAIVGVVLIPWLLILWAIEVGIKFLAGSLGWFCLVKKQGCCGKVGFLVWGLLYLFGTILLTFWSHSRSGLWNILLAVPCMFLTVGCVGKLIAANDDQARSLTFSAAVTTPQPSAPPPTEPAPASETAAQEEPPPSNAQ